MYKFTYANSRYITADESLIFVKKLTLSADLQQAVDELNSRSYLWNSAGRTLVEGSDFHNGFINTASVYNEETKSFIDSLNENLFKLCYKEFEKLDPKAKLISIIRGLMSQSHTRGNMKPASPHSDTAIIGHWSFLIHLKGTSGNTNFLENAITKKIVKTVKFEPLNLIIFPSVYIHQGLLPDDNINRYGVNFIASIDSSLNEKVLEKSPDIIKKIAAASKEFTGEE